MKRALQGKYVTVSTVGEKVQAFIPAPLPPTPPIEWSPELRIRFEQALLALGRLDSVSSLLPNTSLFLYLYVRKEAVLSSMIEGTQSSLSDLLLYELGGVPDVPLSDVEEVSSYVAALNHGLKLLNDGLPISLRLMREVHKVLLSNGRGRDKAPGEFRRTQNWIGGTRPSNAAFVPPPPEAVLNCMGQLELFIHDDPVRTPTLLKAALTHVQFETIHPFLDGNGRLGRLLITLLLCSEEVLTAPMLYLSLYFKTHRTYYYELLNRVRLTGDWEAWLEFFADAVTITSSQAVETAKQLHAQAEAHQNEISKIGRAAPSVLRVHQALMEHPLASTASLVTQTGLTAATINAALRTLASLGIVQEVTQQKRNRLYLYTDYINIMSRGIELPES